MKLRSKLLFVVGCLCWGSILAEGKVDPRYQESYDYALKVSHKPGCVLDNGYVCSEEKEKAPGISGIAGVYVPVLIRAYEAFKEIQDLTNEQKRLEHYKISISDNDTEFLVEFGALLLPKIKNGKPDGIILMSIGRSTKLWIDKSTLKVNKRLFSKN